MPPVSPIHDPYAAFRVPAYRSYSVGYFVSVLGRQMVTIAVGYEIFQRTDSATALGLVGLVGAVPVILFALPAGQVADMCNRKVILLITQAITLLCSLGLAALSHFHDAIPQTGWLHGISRGFTLVASWFGEKNVVFDPAIPLVLALLGITATVRTFGWAARGAFISNIVPRTALANAVTWNSSNFQISSMIGPALGGLVIFQFGLPAAYLLDAVCGLIFMGLLLPVRHSQESAHPAAHPLSDLFSGLRFVWNTKIILATITLDLFAMLFGGATVLLPMFADRILHVGPAGLGWLRAAPSAGALLMGLAIAMLPPMRRAGLAMLWSVGGFGLATVVFGLSHSFWLSIVALALTGALDNVSVVVRHTLVQLRTPDTMRGRVSAVNNVFIGSSNELGALESGLTAALFGPALAVAGGGVATILVVIAVAFAWPEVRRIGPLQESDDE